MSAPFPDGGAAFPTIAEGGVNSGLNSHFERGMSLRDYAAIKIMASIYTNPQALFEDARGHAVVSVAVADALIAELRKEGA